VAKMGPDPILLSRKEVDALYETMAAVVAALDKLGVDYIVTGGSLLGAIRQHSILFCDDDIDITIIDRDLNGQGGTAYSHVRENLADLLGGEYTYLVRPWEGGDKVRPKRMTSVFVDIFTLRRFATMKELTDLIGVKKNGQPQSDEYVNEIVSTIETCAGISRDGQGDPLCPFWHFDTRKAVEMWKKEVYREHELFPLCTDLKMGPLTDVKGPRMPVLLLKRAFGDDCFEVYFQSGSHKQVKPARGAHKTDTVPAKEDDGESRADDKVELKPLVLGGGSWEGGRKAPLEDGHYVPMQSLSCAKRRPTLHCREQLFQYLAEQTQREEAWLREEQGTRGGGSSSSSKQRPQRTVYMDGVFDLFHVGHLAAIRQCAELGSRVIIGVTGDVDATGYKRPPIISEANRVAVVEALREVDAVICPCPLVVTEAFMTQHRIDLVVHGFANDADAARQQEFFATPIALGKFQRIGYYHGLSTTDIINQIRALPPE